MKYVRENYGHFSDKQELEIDDLFVEELNISFKLACDNSGYEPPCKINKFLIICAIDGIPQEVDDDVADVIEIILKWYGLNILLRDWICDFVENKVAQMKPVDRFFDVENIERELLYSKDETLLYKENESSEESNDGLDQIHLHLSVEDYLK